MGTYLMTLHTVWMHWTDDDAIELHGALDDHLVADNHDAYEEMVEAAARKVGRENVREVKVDVDWADICAAFEPAKVEGTVAMPENRASSPRKELS